MSRLREGRANTARGAAHFLRETVGRVRYAGARGQLTVRADSGFYAHAIVAVCRKMDVRFSITIRQHARLRNIIEAIPETDWTPIPYWMDGAADVAETSYAPFQSKPDAAPVRLVNGGGKVDHMGGSIVGLRRWKTVPPATFYKVDYQPLEGETDVSSGDVRSGARACMVEGMSVRETEASRVFGLHRDTVRKMLAYSVPPGYRREGPPRRPKLEAFTGVIDAILEGDSRVPRKQRHTAKRVFERLKDEYGFDGQYTIVKDYVRERGRRTQEMFVPLSHPPGHAQCDFGEAVAIVAGVERKVHYFVLDLPHSDGCFVKAYPAETTEAFLDGHVSAFALLGGAPHVPRQLYLPVGVNQFCRFTSLAWPRCWAALVR